MIGSVFINLIFLLFPVLCYFIYVVYSKASLKEENNIFFDLSLFMSFYICGRFGNVNLVTSLFLYIPLIILIHNKRYLISVITIIVMSYMLCRIYDINIIYLLLLNFIILLLSTLKHVKAELVYVVAKVIFYLFVILFNLSGIINNESYFIFIEPFITYALIKLSYYFYNKIDEIINLYHSLKDVMKEKKLYESLFKITHEIKNPLAVCKGYLDMFDTNNREKTNKYIGIINQEINRTLEILKDFSDVSKSISIIKGKMDVTMLVEDVCDEVKLIFNKDITFSYDVPKEEIYIVGDYNRLKQVLINVIKNGKESIDKKGSVILAAKCNKNNYIINIEDNGCGIEESIKEKIGVPFFTTKKNGTGLGVCFSKEIIDKHNGEINYYSNNKKGTRVEIILPLNKA